MTAFQSNLVQILASAFIVFGGFAIMAGQALARMWRPWTQCLGYSILLSVGARLAEYVLFIGRSQNFVAYLSDNLLFLLIGTAYLMAVTVAAHRITLARMMATQYPWLYERAGLFTWRAKR